MQIVLGLFIFGELRVAQPRFSLRTPLPAVKIVDEQDSATRHCRWRREVQVANLQQHTHVILEVDAVTVSQSQHFVVVHDTVHGLNPVGVQITIQDDPLRAISVPAHLFQPLGEHTFLPAARSGGSALEVVARLHLRVDVAHAHLGPCLVSGFDQHLLDACLGGACRPHDERAVADLHDFSQLQTLVDEIWIGVHLVFFAGFSHQLGKFFVYFSGWLLARKQVAKQT